MPALTQPSPDPWTFTRVVVVVSTSNGVSGVAVPMPTFPLPSTVITSFPAALPFIRIPKEAALSSYSFAT
jgi:hypothetical protein